MAAEEFTPMAMNLVGPVTVQLDQLRQTFYVRTALNQDHVIYLADLYETGEKVKPIIVNEKMEIIDGRHRFEAMHALLLWKEGLAFIAKGMSRQEMLVEALRSNMGGTLPPTPTDIQGVIQQLASEGVRTSDIADMLPI